MTEMASPDDTGVSTLRMPANIHKPNPQSTLILVTARQPNEITLKGRWGGPPNKHGTDGDNDGRQRSSLMGRNNVRNATAAPGAYLKGRAKKGM